MNSVHVKIIQILPSSPNFLCIHGSKSIHSSLYFSTVIIPVDLLLDNPHVCWKSKYWMRSVPCKFVNIAVKLLTVDSIVVSGCVCRHALMCFGKGSNLYFLKVTQLHTYTYMRWLCRAWTALLCVVVLHWTCHTFFFFLGGGGFKFSILVIIWLTWTGALLRRWALVYGLVGVYRKGYF